MFCMRVTWKGLGGRHSAYMIGMIHTGIGFKLHRMALGEDMHMLLAFYTSAPVLSVVV